MKLLDLNSITVLIGGVVSVAINLFVLYVFLMERTGKSKEGQSTIFKRSLTANNASIVHSDGERSERDGQECSDFRNKTNSELPLLDQIFESLNSITNVLVDSRHLQNECLSRIHDNRDVLHKILQQGSSNGDLAQRQLLNIGKIEFRGRSIVKEHLKYLEKMCLEAPKVSYAIDRYCAAISPKTIVDLNGKKFVVVSLAIGDDYIKSVALCLESHTKFARFHRYAYLLLNQPPIDARPPAWMKIPLIYRMLEEEYEYVIYMDADAMVTNIEKNFDYYAAKMVELDRCICLTTDASGVNSGVMLVRNTGKTKALLDLIWMYDIDIDHGLWEQNSLRYLMETFQCVRDQIIIDPDPRNFNSFPAERSKFFPTQESQVWMPGDMICHFSGIRSPYLELYLSQYASFSDV